MYLALRKGEAVTIQEVSDRFGVSKNHMVKISHQLTKSGLIESIRGRNGGVRLSRSPERISAEEALRATEDNFDLVECFNKLQNRCVISDVCRLSGLLDSALAAFFKVLRDVSLSDLVKNSKALEKALLPFPKAIPIKFHNRTFPASKVRGG